MYKRIKNYECEGNPVYKVIGTEFYIARSSTAYCNEVYVFTMDKLGNLKFEFTSCDNLKNTAKKILGK